MKDARTYEKEIKKLIKAMPKTKPSASTDDPVKVMIESILAADAGRKQVSSAMAALTEEFVDFNELRVAQPKEIVECLGKDFPDGRRKAEMILSALHGVFEQQYSMSLEYARKMTKKELQRHMAELGLDDFASACMMINVFGGHAIPVDQSLVDCLVLHKSVHPESTISDVKCFLERIIPQKDAQSAHEFFRGLIAKNAKAIEEVRKARQEAIEAEQRAREEAERKKREEAERKAKEAEERKAAREAAKKLAAEKKAQKAKDAEKARKAQKSQKAKKTGKATKKKPVKKAAPKTAKRKTAKKK